MTDSELYEIVKIARNVFCNGIYVPSDEHPCGWDYISFGDMGLDNKIYEENVLNNKFELDEISNGNYKEHSYEGLTLREILERTNHRYAYEIEHIYW